ncbi:MAG: histidine phosphatase family protein [Actinomycetota bacterium]|nr:histidine phosphatase family protein [Actinomycetota bacterium]
MDIWLARHGATAWSRSGQHTGVTDLPLLPDGEEEARAIGRRLDGHPFGRVLCSPLSRARETARLAGHPDPEVTDLLREVDYGRYEGLTTKQIQADRPGWELFDDGSPGGETPEEIAERADRLLAEIGEPDGDVLLFGHGHILRALAARYLGMEVRVAGLLRLDAGSLSTLGHEHDHHALNLWNGRVR